MPIPSGESGCIARLRHSARRGLVGRSTREGRGLVPPADGGRYPVTAYVRRNYTKIDETRFFDLYR
jgi:hypothetical protein